MTYNAMYERLGEGGSNRVHGYIAYGLYKNAKREWIRQFETEHDRRPKPVEVKAYVDGYTPQMLEVFHSQAGSVLAEFADGAVSDAKPAIVEAALKGNFWRSVGQSIAANIFYTLGLIAVVLVLRWAGVDLLSIVSAGQ
jgi:hypothetical protein